jgi:hypothetical protein
VGSVANLMFATCAACGRPIGKEIRGGRRYCDDPLCIKARRAFRMRKSRQPKEPVRTVHANNATAVAGAAQLYIADGSTVLDVTWGKGAFWAKTDTGRFNLIGSDLDPGFGGAAVGADFRNLPYASGSADHVILDPPYIAWPGKHITDHRYNNAKTTGWESERPLSFEGILQLYKDGMAEAHRVLKPKGLLWVKCKDQVNGGRQHPAQFFIQEYAIRELGMYEADLFVVVPPSTSPDGRWNVQRTARKNHSFLLLFRNDRPR